MEPRHGATAWFSGTNTATAATPTTATPTTATLTTRTLDVPNQASLVFDLFVDTPSSDPMTLESSTDEGTTWRPVPFTVRDRETVSQTDGSIAISGTRRWLRARADLPTGPQRLRWQVTSDANDVARGVYVDGVRVAGEQGVVLDGERHPETMVALGWTQARR